MKLKIKEIEYKLNWGFGTFAEVIERIGEKHNLVNEVDVIANFNNRKVYLETIYCALLVGKQIELDDDDYKLPFSKATLQDWIEEQPQEINEEIIQDFHKYTVQGKDWQTRIEEIVAKLNEMNSELEEEPKKKATKRKPSQTKKDNVLDGDSK